MQPGAWPWSLKVGMGPPTPVKAGRFSAVGSTDLRPESVPDPRTMELQLVKGFTGVSVEALR